MVTAMNALHRKLLRDLLRLWPQALAIALVLAAGAATLILGVGAHESLAETRAAYYERNRFADVFDDLTRAHPVLFEKQSTRRICLKQAIRKWLKRPRRCGKLVGFLCVCRGQER